MIRKQIPEKLYKEFRKEFPFNTVAAKKAYNKIYNDYMRSKNES